MVDVRTNGAFSTVATAPSPATSGTSLTLQTGDGARFPVGTFFAVVCPANTQPIFVAGSGAANAEIVAATRTAGSDVLTIARARQSTAARSIVLGDQVFMGATAQWIDQILGIPSYAQGQSLQHAYEPSHGVHNWTGSVTRKGDMGLANAAGGGMSSELWVGTSASAGCTNNVGTPITYDRLNSVPLIMRDQLAIMGTPANGDGFVRCTDLGVADARWTSSGSWTAPGGVYVTSATLSSSITFTATRPATICEVWYNNTFTGTMTVVIDGTTAGTIVGAGTSGWTFKKFANLAMVAGSKVVITLTTAGTGCGVSGVRTWTPNAGLIVDNVSQSGSMVTSGTTSNWSDAGAASPQATFKDVSGRRRVVSDLVTTATSTTVTSATAVFTANKDEGLALDTIPGASTSIPLPPGTYIVSVTNSTTVVVSNPANVTSSAQTASVGRDPAVVHIEQGSNDVKSSIGSSAATIVAAVNALATAIAPNSDVYLHLPEELNPSLYTGTAMTDFQAAMFFLADTTMNVPLIDWRDRTGPYNITYNSVYGDSQAHLNSMTYRSIGAEMALYRCPGGYRAQSWQPPINDGDVVNYKSLMGVQRFATVFTATQANLSGTTEQVAYTLAIPPNNLVVGNVFRLVLWATISGTTPTISARTRMGTLGTTSDASVVAGAQSTTITSGGGVKIEAEFTIRSIGASGTVFGNTLCEADNIVPRVSNSGAAATIDTTSKLFATITIVMGGTLPVLARTMGYVELIN